MQGVQCLKKIHHWHALTFSGCFNKLPLREWLRTNQSPELRRWQAVFGVGWPFIENTFLLCPYMVEKTTSLHFFIALLFY